MFTMRFIINHSINYQYANSFSKYLRILSCLPCIYLNFQNWRWLQCRQCVWPIEIFSQCLGHWFVTVPNVLSQIPSTKIYLQSQPDKFALDPWKVVLDLLRFEELKQDVIPTRSYFLKCSLKWKAGTKLLS
jgi:hypothetical protein